MRAVLGFLKKMVRPEEPIYLTEQTTPLFQATSRLYPAIIGSEFLRDGTPLGQCNSQGIRHEDVTQLTISSRSINHICSFDVLEHVPDYSRALREFYRCLKPGGTLMMTLPFNLGSSATVARARLLPDGTIDHLLPPQYHGDPLNENGVLCFYDFGWDLLDEMKSEGFSDVFILLYWSCSLGYLGGMQFFISARKRFEF
jgi:hypothetical protein